MLRRAPVALGFVFLSVSVVAAAGPKQAQLSAPRHLLEAIDLVNRIQLKDTTYRHGEPSVTFAGACSSHADCSGFVLALMEHSYDLDADAVRRWLGSSRPTAARFYDAVVAGQGFLTVKTVPEIRPGDLVAIKYLKRTDNTGHVMIAVDEPRRIEAIEPLVPGTVQFELPVIDSSKSAHGRTDTRYKRGAGGEDHDGLGRGVVRIYANADGSIAGYAWSTFTASKFAGPDDQPLVVGRLNPQYRP